MDLLGVDGSSCVALMFDALHSMVPSAPVSQQFGVGNQRDSEEEQALKDFVDQQVYGSCLWSEATLIPLWMFSWTAGVVIISYAGPWPPTWSTPKPDLASRLDSIWWLPCPQAEVQLLNAAIFWQWDRNVDHDPVLVNLALHLPEASNSPSVSTLTELSP